MNRTIITASGDDGRHRQIWRAAPASIAESADAAGRIAASGDGRPTDAALFMRMAEMAGAKYIPREWPRLRPVFQAAVQQYGPPKAIAMIRRTLGSVGPWGWLTDTLATAYQGLQYGYIPPPKTGHIPTPSNEINPALAYNSQDPSYAVVLETAAGARQSNIDATARAIQAAMDSGVYSPAGDLPIDATWADQYKWWIIAGVAALALLILIPATSTAVRKLL